MQDSFPSVPGYAWAWLQRSRPVLTTIAGRLTGAAPTPGFVDELRARFAEDPFTRDVVIAVVAEVAFNGRVPARRPAGASWDRGLTWWAAALVGTTPAEFEARGQGPAPSQRRLFDGEAEGGPRERPQGPARWRTGTAPPGRPPSVERVALVRALRDLLAQAEAGAVPAAAVRQLLADLEGEDSAADR